VRFWYQEAADGLLLPPPGGPRGPDSGLIPNFQTVSPRTPVNRASGCIGCRRVASFAVERNDKEENYVGGSEQGHKGHDS
jgi:hypothetical protein